ncbi:glycosyltransferase family 4 protein [Aequorivita sp. SDUM287046]|uniref:Glycosyltransferase family 4 protein n=1 Tax=Aequorivita aurantiaca TaxID=3053356 RepID=A0ABT8DPY0_9FLAO|nr:glycosyltransferase family 4 protein [Aequorivita aurantiaca]MDN3725303.1 glycosyltransferase family 4 protein [Aequorivita aurantiaca]
MPRRKKLLYIGNKLAAHGRNPTAIDILPSKLEAEGFSALTASSQENKFLRLFDMIWVTFSNRKNIDLVLIDTYSTQNFLFAVIIAALCRFYKLPYIPILHGGNLPNRLKKNQSATKKLFGNALTNVAPSQYMMKHFQEAGFQNLTYIPNALNIEAYPFHLRETITPKLFWLRSFSEIYNPSLALEIVSLLKKKGSDVSLTMIGPDKEGSMHHYKKTVSQLDLPILFPGQLQKAEWIPLSKNFDIFINTTNFDNMPLSVMEAMALGFPVISTNVGGMPYLIEDGVDGILVPPNNAQLFVNAIEQLCQNPIKAQQIAQNARKKIETFHWEIVKHKWINLLDD